MRRSDRAAKGVFFALPFLACWLLFPDIRDNASRQLASLGSVARATPEWRASLLRPDAGLRHLPVPSQAMLFLLHKHGVTRYRFSNSIRGDRLLVQRLVEGGYPAVPDRSSPHGLLREGDSVEAGCRIVDRAHAEDSIGNGAGAVLVRCD